MLENNKKEIENAGIELSNQLENLKTENLNLNN